MELKNCPFCGGKPLYSVAKKGSCQLHGEPYQYVNLGCQWKNCTAYPKVVGGDIYCGGEAAAKSLAVERWNTRVQSSDTADKAKIEALEAALRWYGAANQHDIALDQGARARITLAGSSAPSAAKPAEVVE